MLLNQLNKRDILLLTLLSLSAWGQLILWGASMNKQPASSTTRNLTLTARMSPKKESNIPWSQLGQKEIGTTSGEN